MEKIHIDTFNTNANQYLTFNIENEEFALRITDVREVIDYTHITKVPRSPEHLCGVINLRGNVVSVIDLRIKLGMKPVKITADTCFVIVEVTLEGDKLQMGIIADSVQKVIHLTPDKIDAPPKIGTKLNPEFIRGIGKQDEGFIIILNIENVLSRKDMIIPRSEIEGEADES